MKNKTSQRFFDFKNLCSDVRSSEEADRRRRAYVDLLESCRHISTTVIELLSDKIINELSNALKAEKKARCKIYFDKKAKLFTCGIKKEGNIIYLSGPDRGQAHIKATGR